MNIHKTAKISSDMSRVISEIIFNDTRDEILKTITITGCKVSRDLSYAKVYFTSMSTIDQKTLEREVNEAAPYIRSLVALKLNLRHTPELEFVFDTSIEYGNRIEKIIQEIHGEK